MDKIEQTIDSREVAEMIGKEHKVILRDIRRYSQYFIENKIVPNEFWVESTYKDKIGRKLPAFDVKKKGCEFIAHKLTGEKGAVFTARYINRFHEMEDAIREARTLPTLKHIEPPKLPDKRKALQNWLDYMLTVLEEYLNLSKANMLHQSYEGMKSDGLDVSGVKADYIRKTGNIDCSTFEAVCNDRVAAQELAETLCRNMVITLIKRDL